MNIDYKEIGNRIRMQRKRKNISQEQLAELAELSIPHISHIETANTKLSLPVLVQIANALNITPDDLLCDSVDNSFSAYEKEISLMLSGCDINELRIVSEIVHAAVSALHKNKVGN